MGCGASSDRLSSLEQHVADLTASLASANGRTAALEAELIELEAHCSELSPRFSLAQYNILASYLGRNTEPWFLYGADVDAERRGAILKKFYERDSDGKIKNAGWPAYVKGLLTAEEIARVEEEE